MIYEMSQSLRKSGLCRRDMKKDFGMLIADKEIDRLKKLAESFTEFENERKAKVS